MVRQSQALERTGCVNYPSRQFNSYRDCDNHFLSLVSQNLNINTFWAAADLSEVTRETTNLSQENIMQLWNLFDGTRESDCGRPCLKTFITGHELADWINPHQHSTLAFTFDGPAESSSLQCFR